jgi:hypothetical protein
MFNNGGSIKAAFEKFTSEQKDMLEYLLKKIMFSYCEGEAVEIKSLW